MISNMLRFATVASIFVAAASAAGIRTLAGDEIQGIVEGIVPCGTGEGYLINVQLTNCTDLPCQLLIGKEYEVEVQFIPRKTN
ncbi:unnamed protein product [Allacma fusca]|uniref:Uncharacterized protein n=1 Tax=Allacma fusca TaxID=39272 RepID=A0A8J2P3Q5_9HEXA|nr:unnamed protein product [Allacma fusca]